MTFRGAAVCECGEHGFVGLSRGMVSLVSPEDVGVVSGRKWSAHRVSPGYLYATNNRSGCLAMHRMVMAPKCGEVVDHINGDTLDNRRSNLRVCSNTENLRNRKGSKSKKEALPKGVFRRKSLDRFEAKIGFERRLIFLGVFDTVDAATAAYNAAALEMHGNFARLSGDAK